MKGWRLCERVAVLYNRCIFVGRLGRDPELRYTQSGKAVATFNLAVDRGDTEKNTDWITCVVWDKQAETVSQYLTKGRLVLVEGRLQQRSYEGKDKQKKTVYELHANTVRFLPDGKSHDGQPTPQGGGKPQESGGFDPAGDEPGF